MGKILLCLVATASIFSAAMEQAHALVITSSTFDANAEGWTVGDVTSSTAPSGSAAPIYNSAGGNPAGYISTVDGPFTNVAFLAPSAFVTGLSYGGTFSFDIAARDGTDGRPYSALIIYGNSNGSVTSVVANGPIPSSNGTFTHMSFALTQAAFRSYSGSGSGGGGRAVTQSEFQAVLEAATAVAVFADWKSGVGEETALDNVILTGLDVSPVPVPAALPLFASALGLAGLFGYARKRKAA